MAAPLVFNGAPINIDPQDPRRLSLTDMWRAAGSDRAKRPVHWRSSKQARDLAELLEDRHKDPIRAEKSGRRSSAGGGGTWAHWQLALAYAKYLSPKFHVWCNEVVRAHMERQCEPIALILPPPPAFGMRYVYFIKTGAFVKIGSTRNVKKRLSALQTASPTTLSLVGVLPGGFHVEHDVQERFAASRVHGEWFNWTPEIQAFISSVSAPV